MTYKVPNSAAGIFIGGRRWQRAAEPLSPPPRCAQSPCMSSISAPSWFASAATAHYVARCVFPGSFVEPFKSDAVKSAMTIAFNFTPELRLTDGRIIRNLNDAIAFAREHEISSRRRPAG